MSHASVSPTRICRAWKADFDRPCKKMKTCEGDYRSWVKWIANWLNMKTVLRWCHNKLNDWTQTCVERWMRFQIWKKGIGIHNNKMKIWEEIKVNCNQNILNSGKVKLQPMSQESVNLTRKEKVLKIFYHLYLNKMMI